MTNKDQVSERKITRKTKKKAKKPMLQFQCPACGNRKKFSYYGSGRIHFKVDFRKKGPHVIGYITKQEIDFCDYSIKQAYCDKCKCLIESGWKDIKPIPMLYKPEHKILFKGKEVLLHIKNPGGE
jgi:RNase P subunit RPR2